MYVKSNEGTPTIQASFDRAGGLIDKSFYLLTYQSIIVVLRRLKFVHVQVIRCQAKLGKSIYTGRDFVYHDFLTLYKTNALKKG